MVNCYQFETVNMLDHGNMVHEYYKDLYNLIISGNSKYTWDIPDGCLDKLKTTIPDLLLIPDVKNYHVYHDCGKHISKFIDEEGRQHFPNHAMNSYTRWMECGGDGITGYLILNDMYFHTTETKCLTRINYYGTLLLTAWAEVHANSTMFGGIDSVSFKIKRKKLVKATNKLL